MKRINNTPNFHVEVMAAIIDFLILIRYSKKRQWMWIHNAQLMLQGITLSHALSLSFEKEIKSYKHRTKASSMCSVFLWHSNVYQSNQEADHKQHIS